MGRSEDRPNYRNREKKNVPIRTNPVKAYNQTGNKQRTQRQTHTLSLSLASTTQTLNPIPTTFFRLQQRYFALSLSRFIINSKTISNYIFTCRFIILRVFTSFAVSVRNLRISLYSNQENHGGRERSEGRDSWCELSLFIISCIFPVRWIWLKRIRFCLISDSKCMRNIILNWIRYSRFIQNLWFNLTNSLYKFCVNLKYGGLVVD